ncbi:TonB-dependent receptor [Tsuneonella amylolytica]|uniref:TonB-dependent receptor n=1 Tax=Tsuneonella amylolytica TaxID=2338327 RepID=UPI001F407637|nr:TonB-dependent receptor [Tsuneonella amylolytica]
MDTMKINKCRLAAGSALQALALLGAGVAGSAMIAAPAAAQDYTRGNLTGTVVDSAGAPVSGATVTVTSNEQGFTNTTTTDAAGNFRVNTLPTGTYTVNITAGGQTVVNDPTVQVIAGQNNPSRYIAGGTSTEVPVGDTQGIVVVGRRVATNDFAATQAGVTLDVENLAVTVPVGRDQTSLILLAPQTTSGDGGFGNFASVGGATVAENAYYVNGLNITDFRNFLGGSIIPFEFYRTIDVKTGGYQAEYGRALGGVTSAVTKSGSNEVQAGAVLNYSPNSLRSRAPNTFVDSDNDPTTTGDTINALNSKFYSESLDANFYLSGPIIRDRLFVYGLYNPRYFKQTTYAVAGNRAATTTSNSPFFGAKVDFVITDGHRLEGTYFRDEQVQNVRYTGVNPTTFAREGSQGGLRNEFGGNNFIGTYTGQFTDFLTLSASYGQYNDKSISTASPNQAYVLSRIGGNRVVGGTVAGRNTDTNKREIYRADADVYVNFLGEHHFRGGFDLEKLTAGEETSYNGTGYRYDIRDNRILRYFYQNNGGFRTDQRAFYLQDAWSLLDGRVNLQLGVRNDRFKNYNVEGNLFYDSGDQWAPRLGASFDVFGDGRTKVNAFYGRYYLPVATNTNIRLGGAELYYLQDFLYPTGINGGVDANDDGIPDGLVFSNTGDVPVGGIRSGSATCPTAGPNGGERCLAVYSDGLAGATDTLISSTLKPSYTDEWRIGAEHRFGDFKASLYYTKRKLGETLEDAAIDAAVIAYCDANGVAGCDSVFTGFHQYVLLNPGSDVTVRLDGDCSIAGQCDVVTLAAEDLGYPKATRKYDSITFELDKRFNGLYGLNFNYTYTKLRGNYEGAVKSDNNQTDAGLTQDFDQPGFLDGAFGDLANGRRHAFKLYGYMKPTEWLGIGVNALVESPRKFSCIGNYFDAGNFAADYGAASYYCTQNGYGGTAVTNSDGGTSYLIPRGTAFESDWNKRVDLKLAFTPFAENRDIQFGVDVFNVFNWKAETDFNEFGDFDFDYTPNSNPNYGRVTSYQAPRSVRFNATLRFGGSGR